HPGRPRLARDEQPVGRLHREGVDGLRVRVPPERLLRAPGGAALRQRRRIQASAGSDAEHELRGRILGHQRVGAAELVRLHFRAASFLSLSWASPSLLVALGLLPETCTASDSWAAARAGRAKVRATAATAATRIIASPLRS